MNYLIYLSSETTLEKKAPLIWKEKLPNIKTVIERKNEHWGKKITKTIDKHVCQKHLSNF